MYSIYFSHFAPPSNKSETTVKSSHFMHFCSLCFAYEKENYIHILCIQRNTTHKYEDCIFTIAPCKRCARIGAPVRTTIFYSRFYAQRIESSMKSIFSFWFFHAKKNANFVFQSVYFLCLFSYEFCNIEFQTIASVGINLCSINI